jgi:MoxR-like ATPase
MSGGAFDYDQYKIGYIADQIEHEIEKSGRSKTKEEIKNDFRDPSWYERYPEDLNHYQYPDDVLDEFKKAVKALRIAEVYAHRIDWLLSGDDGNESFIRRLKEGLENIEDGKNK